MPRRAFLFFFPLVALGLVFFSPQAQAADLYVAPAGSNSNPCSTAEAPCETIQGAIDKSSDGDVVRVAPGFYTENLSVNRDLLFLGPNAGIPFGVDREPRGLEAFIRGEAEVAVAGVSFDGFTFLRPDVPETDSPSLLRLTTSGDVLVTNSRFDLGSVPETGPAACGGAISGQASLTVIESSFINQVFSGCSDPSDLSRMIYLTGTGKVELSDSEFNNSEKSVYLSGSAGSEIVENRFLGSSTEGVFLASDDVDVIGNTFAGPLGIEINDSQGSLIQNNLFTSDNKLALLRQGGTVEKISENAFFGAILPPEINEGVTVVNNIPSSLDLQGNAWGKNSYSEILEKINEGASVLVDLWIEEYSDDPAKSERPGFWPLTKSFAWQVEQTRGLARQIGPFFNQSLVQITLPSAPVGGKSVIEAYGSAPYPLPPAPLYLGSPASYFTLEGDLGQSLGANVCLSFKEESFPLFVNPAFYSHNTSWQAEDSTEEEGFLCADIENFSALMIATPGYLPTTVAPPRLLKDVRINKVVNTSPGTWQAYPGLIENPYSYIWQRGKTLTGPWSTIEGETGNTYSPGDRDVGRYLRIRVSAESSFAVGQAVSPPRYVQASGEKTFTLQLRSKKARLLANGKTLFARLSCLEGYCQIDRVLGNIFYQGKKRVKVIYRKTTLIPGETRNIYLKIPGSLYKKLPRGSSIRAQLSLLASSSNRETLSKKLQGRVFK